MIKKTITLIALIAITLPSTVLANNCSYWQDRIADIEHAKRQGGNSSRMIHLQKQLNYFEEQSKRCKKETAPSQKITVYSGAPNHQHEDFIYSDIDNQPLQQLIKTCNYWIEEHNLNPTEENRKHKENSCRDAKNLESEIISPKERPSFIQTRKIKDCIKPNNVIDKDVKLCVQGVKEPTWITTQN